MTGCRWSLVQGHHLGYLWVVWGGVGSVGLTQGRPSPLLPSLTSYVACAPDIHRSSWRTQISF